MERADIVPPYNVEGYEETGSYNDEDNADRIVLDQLVAAGCDLGKERHSIHYLYFDSKSGAQAAGLELEQMGFFVRIGERVESEPVSRRWPVAAEKTEVINATVIAAWRGPLWEIAKRHSGEYDGWEAAMN